MACEERGYSRSHRTLSGNGNHKPACERCKGQKLRCVWQRGLDSCRRCARAQAVCKLPAPRPIGRPRRTSGTGTGLDNSTTTASSKTTLTQAQTGNHNYQNNNVFEEQCGDTDTTSATSHSISAVSQSNVDMPWNLPMISSTSSSLQNAASQMTSNFQIANWQLDASDLFGSPATTPLVSPGRLVHQSSTYTPSTVPNTATTATEIPTTVTTSLSNFVTDFDVNPNSDNAEDYVYWLKQLGDLNVALYQHPLHTKPPLGAASNSIDCLSPEDSNNKAIEISSYITPQVALDGIQIGRLFDMTVQLRGLVNRITEVDYRSQHHNSTSMDHSAISEQSSPDVSALLMALSCYTRLELVYTQMLRALKDIKKHDPMPDDSYRLMPNLALDGYSLGWCHNLQLSFLIQVCEETLISIQRSIKSIQEGMDFNDKQTNKP